jgi:transposase
VAKFDREKLMNLIRANYLQTPTMTITQIAKAAGCSEPTVYVYVRLWKAGAGLNIKKKRKLIK